MKDGDAVLIWLYFWIIPDIYWWFTFGYKSQKLKKCNPLDSHLWGLQTKLPFVKYVWSREFWELFKSTKGFLLHSHRHNEYMWGFLWNVKLTHFIDQQLTRLMVTISCHIIRLVSLNWKVQRQVSAVTSQVLLLQPRSCCDSLGSYDQSIWTEWSYLILIKNQGWPGSSNPPKFMDSNGWPHVRKPKFTLEP